MKDTIINIINNDENTDEDVGKAFSFYDNVLSCGYDIVLEIENNFKKVDMSGIIVPENKKEDIVFAMEQIYENGKELVNKLKDWQIDFLIAVSDVANKYEINTDYKTFNKDSLNPEDPQQQKFVIALLSKAGTMALDITEELEDKWQSNLANLRQLACTREVNEGFNRFCKQLFKTVPNEVREMEDWEITVFYVCLVGIFNSVSFDV